MLAAAGTDSRAVVSPGTKKGDANSDGDGDDSSILRGRSFGVARCKCRGVSESMRKNPPLETLSLICSPPPPPPRMSGLEACERGLGVKVVHVAAYRVDKV
jgi:hypothetical protein